MTIRTEVSPNGKRTTSPHDKAYDLVDIHEILFGENPPEIDPRTVNLKHYDLTKPSIKKCNHIKSYAANTN